MMLNPKDSPYHKKLESLLEKLENLKKTLISLNEKNYTAPSTVIVALKWKNFVFVRVVNIDGEIELVEAGSCCAWSLYELESLSESREDFIKFLIDLLYSKNDEV